MSLRAVLAAARRSATWARVAPEALTPRLRPAAQLALNAAHLRASSTRAVHGPMEPFYDFSADELRGPLQAVTDAQRSYGTALSQAARSSEDLVSTLRRIGLWDVIVCRLSYTSNALEGNTLSEVEVLDLLRSRVPQPVHTFEEQEDVIAHARGLEYAATLAERGTLPASSRSSAAPLTASDIRGLHAMTIPPSKDNVPGAWRDGERATYSKDASGASSVLYYPSSAVAAAETGDLLRWISEKEGHIHPVILASIGHYNLVRAHPFGDGNGRMGRLLSTLLLLRSGYMPSVIEPAERTRYLNALHAADHRRTLSPLILLTAEGTIRCLEQCAMRK